MVEIRRQFARCVLLMFMLMLAVCAKAQDVTISNNLLYDATLTPNLSLGVQVSPNWSVGFTAGFNPWPRGNLTTKKHRHLLLSPEVRYWTDSLQLGHFFGVNPIYSHFNAGYTDMVIYKGVKDERRQGDLVALGLFYGYSWRLGSHWSLEAAVGAAVGYAWYDRFHITPAGDNWKFLGDDKTFFVMPQLGLNIVYHFSAREKKQKTDGSMILTSSEIERK